MNNNWAPVTLQNDTTHRRKETAGGKRTADEKVIG